MGRLHRTSRSFLAVAPRHYPARPAAALALLAALVTPLAAQDASTVAGCSSDLSPAVPFGPAIPASDTGRIYSSLLTPDGREFWFFRRIGDARSEDYRIYKATRRDGGWGPAERVNLGGEFSDLYPSFSADGARLVFSSYRPVPGDTSAHPNAHLWMAQRTASGWSTPELLPASRIGWYHSGVGHDAQGNLTFRMTSPDWQTGESMRLRWLGTAYAAEAEPAPNPAAEYWREHLGDTVHVWGTMSSPGGIALVQVSQITGPNRRRGPSVNFVSRRDETGWTPLVRAGGGLGEGAPNFLWFSADGCFIHYTRDYSSFWRAPIATVVAGVRP